MAIVASDILYRLSGGASNSSQGASLGGAKSTTTVASASLFDDVSAAESAAGDIEYRCYYIHNAHATLTLTAPVAWIAANTPSASTTIDIGVGTSALNGTEQGPVTDENTAPTGITFSAAATQGAGVALGDIPPGQHRAVWIRRTVTAGAAAAAETYTLRCTGSTAP